jgi:hypothetical protein
MKPKMMSKNSLEYLFNHILDGFRSSHEGIIQLQHDHLVTDDEIHELVRKNSERLIDRIREFKIIEKLTCIFFAALFGYMQISGSDLEARRPARTRTSSSRSASRSGRRRNDSPFEGGKGDVNSANHE